MIRRARITKNCLGLALYIVLVSANAAWISDNTYDIVKCVSTAIGVYFILHRIKGLVITQKGRNDTLPC